MQQLFAPLLALSLAAACTMETAVPIAAPTAASFAAASTEAELLAMGGQKLTADGITQEVIGRSFNDIEGGWTWNILADGSQNSTATDGSWSVDVVRWTITGDQFCRARPGDAPKCSDIYQLGDVFRWSEGDGLANWAVMRQ